MIQTHSQSLSNDTVTAIAADLRNEVWVGTFQGLNHVDRFTNEVERITPEDEELAGLTSRITGFLTGRIRDILDQHLQGTLQL